MVSFLFKSLLLALSFHNFREVSVLVAASRPHIIMIVADDLVRIRNTAIMKRHLSPLIIKKRIISAKNVSVPFFNLIKKKLKRNNKRVINVLSEDKNQIMPISLNQKIIKVLTSIISCLNQSPDCSKYRESTGTTRIPKI